MESRPPNSPPPLPVAPGGELNKCRAYVSNFVAYLWHWRMPLAILLFFICAVLLPVRVTPFSLPGVPEKASELMFSMSETLGGLLGIIVAVVLVGFEILKKRIGLAAARETFRDPAVTALLWLYGVCIFIDVLSDLCVEQGAPVRASNLVALNVCLFVICIVRLIGGMRRIIEHSQSPERYRELAQSIQPLRAVGSLHLGGVVEGGIIGGTRSLHLHPAHVLADAAVRELEDGNEQGARLAVAEAASRLIDLLRTRRELDWVAPTFLPVFDRVFERALSGEREGPRIPGIPSRRCETFGREETPTFCAPYSGWAYMRSFSMPRDAASVGVRPICAAHPRSEGGGACPRLRQTASD